MANAAEDKPREPLVTVAWARRDYRVQTTEGSSIPVRAWRIAVDTKGDLLVFTSPFQWRPHNRWRAGVWESVTAR